MHKKGRKLPVLFIIIFIGAFILSAFLSAVLPVPDRYAKTVFFGLAPALAAAGILIARFIEKRK